MKSFSLFKFSQRLGGVLVSVISLASLVILLRDILFSENREMPMPSTFFGVVVSVLSFILGLVLIRRSRKVVTRVISKSEEI
ncbi:MAG TPA: hypothetical protein VF412_17775 [Bdellovibrio sp.]|uniref:hypothetical protein n=1 Tax=Bdellovibrio sp. TaxID=28201 RepID=UPI002F02240E